MKPASLPFWSGLEYVHCKATLFSMRCIQCGRPEYQFEMGHHDWGTVFMIPRLSPCNYDIIAVNIYANVSANVRFYVLNLPWTHNSNQWLNGALNLISIIYSVWFRLKIVRDYVKKGRGHGAGSNILMKMSTNREVIMRKWPDCKNEWLLNHFYEWLMRFRPRPNYGSKSAERAGK